MRLTIQNRSKLVYTKIAGFELFDIHEESDRYVFEFRIIAGTYKVVQIPLSRIGVYDVEAKRWMYQVNNMAHHVSADWFSDRDNVVETFEFHLG
jgi:hypothetical protein